MNQKLGLLFEFQGSISVKFFFSSSGIKNSRQMICQGDIHHFSQLFHEGNGGACLEVLFMTNLKEHKDLVEAHGNLESIMMTSCRHLI